MKSWFSLVTSQLLLLLVCLWKAYQAWCGLPILEAVLSGRSDLQPALQFFGHLESLQPDSSSAAP